MHQVLTISLARNQRRAAMSQFPEPNLRIIHQCLKDRGFTKVQCAAILGCWMQESSLNPYAEEPPPGTGLGLASPGN